tara:strand:+ start:52 stop:192 length:141 start_codon:yes stop_codon:yes gene_type:complete
MKTAKMAVQTLIDKNHYSQYTYLDKNEVFDEILNFFYDQRQIAHKG